MWPISSNECLLQEAEKSVYKFTLQYGRQLGLSGEKNQDEWLLNKCGLTIKVNA